MNSNRVTCDPKRIELFLQQQLSDEEQTAFELHLDDCHDCRRRLDATAAGDDIWSGVRDSLRGQQLPPDGVRSGDSALDWAAGGDASISHATVLKLLAPTDDDRMLGRLGTYEVMGVIGSGGMGVVLKAFDAALNRYVAIKVLAPHLGSSGAARKRFSREAQAAAAVVHDNVMEIYGVADVEGLPYLVMPYVRGPSLQRRLDDEGPLALVEILRIGMQAATGLAAAHAQGLVHRDVKPANILLADGVERVKLTDFGLARAADDASLTKTGIIAGTPQYMSPEQSRGESVDQRSDLFSLGSVLYAMSTGRAPFRAETSYGVLRRITDEEPRPIYEINPDIPQWLCRIISRLMSKQPDDRFASAREVAELLEACLAHVQQPTAVPLLASLVRPSKGNPFFSVSRRTLGVIAMIATLALGLLATALLQVTEPPDIAGRWSGEGWGRVALDQTAAGEYAGTYTDTAGREPGKIQLKWARIERRFNGTWREGEDRFGELSIRLADHEIRGALTTDPKSKVNPATPRLADLLWTRVDTSAAKPMVGTISIRPEAEPPAVSPTAEPKANRADATNALSAMDLLRGVKKARKCNVPLVATLAIKKSTVSKNRNTQRTVDCVVECSGRDRRFEQLRSETVPWAIVTLTSGDRTYVDDADQNKTVWVYYDEARVHHAEAPSFDPRTLGLVELMGMGWTVEECLLHFATDEVKLMGEEEINGIRAWHVKTTERGTTEEQSYWITAPAYEVLRYTRQLKMAFVDIRSEYDEKDPSYPLPKHVTISRIQTVPDESFESKQEITLTRVDWAKSIPAERFTLKSLNLPTNTVIERGSDGLILGYWSGGEIVEAPIREAEGDAAAPPKDPIPPPEQTAPPASKPEERESK